MVHVSEESQTESSNRCGLTADDETIDDYTDSEDSDEIGGHLFCSNLCIVLTLTTNLVGISNVRAWRADCIPRETGGSRQPAGNVLI